MENNNINVSDPKMKQDQKVSILATIVCLLLLILTYLLYNKTNWNHSENTLTQNKTPESTITTATNVNNIFLKYPVSSQLDVLSNIYEEWQWDDILDPQNYYSNIAKQYELSLGYWLQNNLQSIQNLSHIAVNWFTCRKWECNTQFKKNIQLFDRHYKKMSQYLYPNGKKPKSKSKQNGNINDLLLNLDTNDANIDEDFDSRLLYLEKTAKFSDFLYTWYKPRRDLPLNGFTPETWLNFHDSQILPLIRNEGSDCFWIFIGNSITKGWRGETRVEGSEIKELFDNGFTMYEIINHTKQNQLRPKPQPLTNMQMIRLARTKIKTKSKTKKDGNKIERDPTILSHKPVSLANGGDRIQEIGWRMSHPLQHDRSKYYNYYNETTTIAAADGNKGDRNSGKSGNNGDYLSFTKFSAINGFMAMEECGVKKIVLLIGTNDIGSGEKLSVILKEYLTLLIQFQYWLYKWDNHLMKHQISRLNIMDLENNYNDDNNDDDDNDDSNNIDVKNIKSYVRTSDAKVYVTGIFPRDYVWIPGAQDKQTKRQIEWNLEEQKEYFIMINIINEFLNQWAQLKENKEYFQYVDCTQYFLSNKINDNVNDNENDNRMKNQYDMWQDNLGFEHRWLKGTISIDTMYDFLHLTLQGYQAWQQCLYDAVQF